jgi:hypothetical protein
MRDGDCGKSCPLAKIAKIAKTNLLASVSFFFAPFAALREEGPVSRQDRQDKPLGFSFFLLCALCGFA